MIEKRKKNFRCVKGKTPEEFERNMNDLLEDISDPELYYPPTLPLTAYVTYDTWVKEPECLEEVHMLQGDTYRCNTCPYFERTNDLRRRWHYCRFHEKPTRDDSRACEEFYEQLDSGTINITMEEVRKCQNGRR